MSGQRSVALVLAMWIIIGSAGAARAQTPTSPANPSSSASSASSEDDWTFAVYPILAWVPTSITADLNIPLEGGDGVSGSVENTYFDGAFLAGFAASKGRFRVETEGMWAAFGGERINLPAFNVDIDAIYGYGTLGVRVAPDFFVTGGVRRLAVKYDITVPSRPAVSRKPGVWDPIVGIGWHRVHRTIELHAIVETGGFGVGSDSEYSAGGRVDWKFAKHVGVSGGYGYLRFKLSDDVAGRVLVATQTLHGPVVAFGLYF